MLRPRFVVYGALLVSFALRVAPLLQNRFHPDEALYASFARAIAAGKDVWLHKIVVDKPPLPFYLMAWSFSIFGGTEFAARLPHLFASLISVALIYRAAAALYNRPTGAVAATLLTFSPLAILFAITLFTDTLLLMFILASLWAVAKGHWRMAGLMWGGAFACKQTAIFFLPLLGVIGFVYLITQSTSRRKILATLGDFFIPALICVALVFAWDIIRQPPISFWVQGYDDNNPNRIIRTNELIPRLTSWYELTFYLTGSRLIDAIFIVGLLLSLIINHQPTRSTLHTYILLGYTLCFLTAYWLLAFNVWDRYLLVLTPIILILVAQVISKQLSLFAFHFSQGAIIRHLSFVILIIALLPSALTAARSEFPIGGDHGAYDGIDEIAATLRTVPAGSVLYDYWLSWQWRFYLFDGPTYVVWMPDTETIRKDLKAFGKRSPRYIVAPAWESFSEVQSAIEAANFKVTPLKTTIRRDGTVSFTLYQIVSP